MHQREGGLVHRGEAGGGQRRTEGQHEYDDRHHGPDQARTRGDPLEHSQQPPSRQGRDRAGTKDDPDAGIIGRAGVAGLWCAEVNSADQLEGNPHQASGRDRRSYREDSLSGVRSRPNGYLQRMTNSPSEPKEPSKKSNGTADGEKSENDQGYIEDSQLPEDLQPTDDNPLAQNPEEEGDDEPSAGSDS